MSFQKYMHSSFFHVFDRLYDIPIPWLLKQGIKGVVLDCDGVMTSIDSIEIPKQTLEWMISIQAAGILLGIYSNQSQRLFEKRQVWLQDRMPNVIWVPPGCKKPNIKGVEILQKIWGCEFFELLMVDDRFATGGVMAYKAGMHFAYCSNPIQNFHHAVMKEYFFVMIRYIERLFYGWCAREESNL
ncbi:MAG: hypothetical protein FJ161_02525 [Gammaproteobacteria bacterium]|nr:hypothetical protein [Gammaproteobacteria bacterium]